ERPLSSPLLLCVRAVQSGGDYSADLFPLLSWPDAGPALCYAGRDCENAAAGGIGRGATPNDLNLANTRTQKSLVEDEGRKILLIFPTITKRQMEHSSERKTMTISDAQ